MHQKTKADCPSCPFPQSRAIIIDAGILRPAGFSKQLNQSQLSTEKGGYRRLMLGQHSSKTLAPTAARAAPLADDQISGLQVRFYVPESAAANMLGVLRGASDPLIEACLRWPRPSPPPAACAASLPHPGVSRLLFAL